MLRELLYSMAAVLLIIGMVLLICWRVGAWTDRIANRESRITDSDPLEGEGDGGVRSHPGAATIADPVDVAFATAPVDPASQTQVYESHRARKAFEAHEAGCTCPPGPEDDHHSDCAWFGVVLDPTPTQREIAVGEVMGDACTCPRHFDAVVSAPLISADDAVTPQPASKNPAEVAPGAVKHGRNRSCTACILALIDRRPDDVCASCAPTLVGAREITGRPTTRGTQ